VAFLTYGLLTQLYGLKFREIDMGLPTDGSRRRAWGWVWVCLLVLGVPKGGVSQSSGFEGEILTLDQTLEYATDGSPGTSCRQTGVAGSQLGERNVKMWPDPAGGFEHERVWVEEGMATEYIVAAEQTLPIWGGRSLRREAARHEQRAALASEKVECLERRFKAKRSFYGMLHAQRRLEAARQWLDALEAVSSHWKGTRNAEESADALNTLSRSRWKARNAIDEWVAKLARRRSELASLLGDNLPETSDWSVEGELFPGAVVPLSKLREAIEDHPEIERRRHRQKAEQAREKAARKERLPKPELVGGYIQQNEPEATNHGFIVEFWWTIPLSRLGGRATSTNEGESQHQAPEKKTRATRRLFRLHRAASRLVDRARRYRDKIVPASKKRRNRLGAFEDGNRAELEEHLDASGNVYEAKRGSLEASFAAREALIALEEIVGGEE